jgi:ABC-type Zn uptake system ZnuABC Zn-binding protein ZnuA
MCPGHFDLSPRTALTIANADLFIQHGFEPFTRGLTFDDNQTTRIIMQNKGNGMIPSVHRKLTQEILDALCKADPANASTYQTNALAYLDRIEEVEKTVAPLRKRLAGIPVFTAVMNAPFVSWTGCKVVDTFPRDENLSARKMIALLKDGKRRQVRLVVDNQQSLGKTGNKLSQSLSVPLTILSNFPAVEEGGYPAALTRSLKQLTEALATAKAE